MLTRKQKQTIRVAYQKNRFSPELHKIAKQILSNCKRDEYWGQGGAGMMFICSEDDTVLLLLRASWVDQPNTWGVAGGGVGEGWNETPMQPLTNDAVFLNTAKKEAKEECGSLPPNFSTSQIVDKTEYEDCGFRYLTFIADITLEQKAKWKLEANDGETAEFLWVNKSSLSASSRPKGKPLHFGVIYTLSQTTL